MPFVSKVAAVQLAPHEYLRARFLTHFEHNSIIIYRNEIALNKICKDVRNIHFISKNPFL